MEVGEWYGPRTVCLVLRDLVEATTEDVFHEEEVKKLVALVCDDGTIYLDEVKRLCEPQADVQTSASDSSTSKEIETTTQEENKVTEKTQIVDTKSEEDEPKTSEQDTDEPKSKAEETDTNQDDAPPAAERETSSDPLLNSQKDFEWNCSLLLLVPLRLGLDRVNSDYLPVLVTILKHEFCLGIIGGKPMKSLYFVGTQGSDLLYLDPHFVQTCVQTDLQGNNLLFLTILLILEL